MSKGTPAAGHVGKLLRVWLKSPWDDYRDIGYLHSTPQARLVYHISSYFNLAVMREQAVDALLPIQALSSIQHPNIAKTYEVYLYDQRSFVITEYLELSLAQVDFHRYDLEEWEIATIVVQVEMGQYRAVEEYNC